MNTPFVAGWPQIILFLVLVAGVGLMIFSVMGLFSRSVYEDERYGSPKDAYGRHHHHHHRRHRRRFRAGHGLGGVLLLVLALSLLWLAFSVQSYLGLTGEIHIARVHATQIEGQPHLMSVELTQFDDKGQQTSSKTYLVQGDEWMLQGDIIKFPTWMNIIGFHTGYKLTRLEGRFDNADLERNSKHTVVELNGGDDNFFKTVQQQAWVSPIIEAAYGNAVFLGADGKTYEVFVSQTGLLARPSK